MANYRTIYKKYFGIEFDKNYAVHHIDFNRANNDISNLLLLPRELHAKYHFIINALTICPEKPRADGFLNIRLSSVIVTDYNMKILDLLPETIAECQKWLQYKRNNYRGLVWQ